ncbi:hypothetical protein [Undibacterium sp.]|uniref:hypothetical protein n=1 Tax=Undibacterium sp. TaxID=1914977 RepID=UPI00374D8DB8
MYIVAIAWIYVVFMMSITETSVIAGIMTFLMYCVLPLAIIFYLARSPQRNKKRKAEMLARHAAAQTDAAAHVAEAGGASDAEAKKD